MINIFYHPCYFKTKKVFLTKQFKYSIFNNYLIDILYKLNLPMFDNFIYSGPQKRINHLLNSTRNNNMFSQKKNIFDYSYIVQFDHYGQAVLKDLMSTNNPKKKILIGPLYSIEDLKKLTEIVNNNSGIKILTASKSAYINLINEMNLKINKDKIASFPSGIIKKSDVIKNTAFTKRKKSHCLVYFKKRDRRELTDLINFLDINKITFDIFEYGKYKNLDLIKSSRNATFGIVLGTTESQGFGIQSLLANNLPLIVVDKNVNNYEGYKLSGTTVPYWDNNCGLKVKSVEECKNQLNNFVSQINKFSPADMVIRELTYEVFIENLKNEFKKDF